MLSWSLFGPNHRSTDKVIYTALVQGKAHEPIEATLYAGLYNAKMESNTDRCAVFVRQMNKGITTGFSLGSGGAGAMTPGPGTNNDNVAFAGGGLLGRNITSQVNYPEFRIVCLNVGEFTPPPPPSQNMTQAETTAPPPAPQPQPLAPAPSPVQAPPAAPAAVAPAPQTPQPPAPVQPEPKPTTTSEVVNPCILPEYAVYFRYDHDEVDSQYFAVIHSLAGWLGKHPSCKIEVEGSACHHGSMKYNSDLGMRRAVNVYDVIKKEAPQGQVVGPVTDSKYLLSTWAMRKRMPWTVRSSSSSEEVTPIRKSKRVGADSRESAPTSTLNASSTIFIRAFALMNADLSGRMHHEESFSFSRCNRAGPNRLDNPGTTGQDRGLSARSIRSEGQCEVAAHHKRGAAAPIGIVSYPQRRISISIVGYADRTGTGAKNDIIGTQRANDAQTFLLENFRRQPSTHFQAEIHRTPGWLKFHGRSSSPRPGTSAKEGSGVKDDPWCLTLAVRRRPALRPYAEQDPPTSTTGSDSAAGNPCAGGTRSRNGFGRAKRKALARPHHPKRRSLAHAIHDAGGSDESPIPSEASKRYGDRQGLRGDLFYETAIEQLIAQRTIKVQKEKSHEEVLEPQRQPLGSDLMLVSLIAPLNKAYAAPSTQSDLRKFTQAQVALATVHQGEGIEHALIRQLTADPANYGFTGKKDDEKAVKQWAGRQAHLLAIKAGYVDWKFGAEVRVKTANTTAYLIQKNADDSLQIAEGTVTSPPGPATTAPDSATTQLSSIGASHTVVTTIATAHFIGASASTGTILPVPVYEYVFVG